MTLCFVLHRSCSYIIYGSLPVRETPAMANNDSTTPAETQPQQSTHLNGGDDPNPLRSLCTQLHKQVEAFLAEEFQEETLTNAQKQCQHSLKIIHEALDRYPYVQLSLSRATFSPHHTLPKKRRRRRKSRPIPLIHLPHLSTATQPSPSPTTAVKTASSS